ncbi:hypothetical protein LVY74_07210 [Acinetobacter sp. ME22]|uniref:hypothetical protein n=1 Tax=Acinetobacter sp. ME22 TaxID=2904802 RepID=UPI001EDB8BB8|nr:hypothetical protein [Acinetobacter sp. ME22]MCG2573345.1 hypothetical protein [Acinetobacter sp. ME22]
MALDVGADFEKRWLNAPQAVRQTYIDDLSRICELFATDVRLENWLSYNKQAQRQSYERIENAYAELKAELVEQARIRRQHALEQSLAKKRAQQQAYLDDLQLDERLQYQQQTQQLQALRQQLSQESHHYTERYTPTPKLRFEPNANTVISPEIQQALDNLKIRLELEAEGLIEQIQKSIQDLNQKIQQAADEEIRYILEQHPVSEG